MKGWGIWFMAVLVTGCLGRSEQKQNKLSEMVCVGEVMDTAEVKGFEENEPVKVLAVDTETEKRMRRLGLVDIQEMDTTIRVHLVYATTDNFVGRVLYHDLHKAFMLPETAWRLMDAQKHLKTLRPDLSLMIYDAARPMSVQQEMWTQVRGTNKSVYVSNPKNGGGLHNYGAAIDLTLADSLGNILSMGSDFDYFGDEARPDREKEMVRLGRILPEHLANRKLLRRVMTEAGFRVLPSEWWHFNLVSREETKKTLKRIE